jgi:hypothetical protein
MPEVPSGAKTLYQAKELLSLNVLASNAGAGMVTVGGVHVNAYLADTTALIDKVFAELEKT